ncbi:MAG: hypothetical protein K8T25_14570, partial [Planctomycetia bacterium]|nr:hypothetical protein [Planctomycetia bacterium]
MTARWLVQIVWCSIKCFATLVVYFAIAELCSCSAAPAAEPLRATISADPTAKIADVNPLIYGGFLEHFHRCVYGGIYEPGSPLADENGFRKDVVAALKHIHMPILRWPGGLFASAYHWQHGVGRDRLPDVDKAWRVEDPNTFGTDEFIKYCRAVGAEPYLCGSPTVGDAEELSNWVEY